VIATVISVLAFFISLYGVWEKRRDQRKQEFLRLGLLVEELNKLSYEQDRLGETLAAQGRQVPSNLEAPNHSRRVVLCSEAHSLSEKLGRDVSSTQLRVVADNWRRAGRTDLSESLYRNVISNPDHEIDSMYAWRGLAHQLMLASREDEARYCYRQAIQTADQASPHDGWSVSEKCDIYLRWADLEISIGQAANADNLLTAAHKLSSKIAYLPRRRQIINRIDTIRSSLGDDSSSAK
jgi:hypothetical protein